MSKLIALRIYFHHAERATPTRIWHHVARPALATHLLQHARRAGIEQALLHHVEAGYLANDRIHHRHVEHTHHRFPQCLELIGNEKTVRAFWEEHGRNLPHVRAIFLPCEAGSTI